MESVHPSDKNISPSGQQNPKSNTSIALSPLSFFKKDKDFVFVHQKAEKLVSAIYMLTNFLPTEESMKWSLRNLGMSLLTSTIDLKEEVASSRIEAEQSIRNTTLEITSLLEVAQFAGLVSEMNVSILKREFHSLLTFIHTMNSAHGSLESLFVESRQFPIETVEVLPNTNKVTEQSAIISSDTSNTDSVVVAQIESTPIKDNSIISAPKTHVLKEYSPVAVKKNKRQSIIINLLKRKKEIMVKDVSEIIHDCSEKTLQRELLTLVSQGVLAKEGERRWTKYSLAS